MAKRADAIVPPALEATDAGEPQFSDTCRTCGRDVRHDINSNIRGACAPCWEVEHRLAGYLRRGGQRAVQTLFQAIGVYRGHPKDTQWVDMPLAAALDCPPSEGTAAAGAVDAARGLPVAPKRLGG